MCLGLHKAITAAKLLKIFNYFAVLNKEVLILFNTTYEMNKNERWSDGNTVGNAAFPRNVLNRSRELAKGTGMAMR